VAEFGNPRLSQGFSAAEARPAGIELDEFPWVILGTGEVKMAGPIDSSE
jgi:hypothetical protein